MSYKQLTSKAAMACLLVAGFTGSSANAQVGEIIGKKPIEVTADPAEVPTARVLFGDLDLASAAGRDRLRWRIRSAVRQVCPQHGRAPLAEVLAARACRTAALEEAQVKMERIFHTQSAGAASDKGTLLVAARR